MEALKKYVEVDGKFYLLVKNPKGTSCDGCAFEKAACAESWISEECGSDNYYLPVEIVPTKETIAKVLRLAEGYNKYVSKLFRPVIEDDYGNVETYN